MLFTGKKRKEWVLLEYISAVGEIWRVYNFFFVFLLSLYNIYIEYETLKGFIGPFKMWSNSQTFI